MTKGNSNRPALPLSWYLLWCLGTPAEPPALAPGSVLLMQPGAQHRYRNPAGQFQAGWCFGGGRERVAAKQLLHSREDFQAPGEAETASVMTGSWQISPEISSRGTCHGLHFCFQAVQVTVDPQCREKQAHLLLSPSKQAGKEMRGAGSRSMRVQVTSTPRAQEGICIPR